MKALSVVLAMNATASCADGPSLASRFDILNGQANGRAASIPVGIIADTHAHYLWGRPTFIQNPLADRISASAIRTPQSDLWGPDTEEWLLDRLVTTPLIHLGDAADIACVAEYDQFLRMMSRHQAKSHQPWFSVPGNHDSYFYGNYQDTGGHWDAACDGSRKLVKSDLVKWYLSALAMQPDPKVAAIAGQLGAPSGTIDTPKDRPGLLAAVAWKEYPSEPWRSWIVQELDLSIGGQRPVLAILLDTAVYDLPPILVPGPGDEVNAGLHGDVGAEQAAVVRAWAATARKLGATLLVLGHHPYDSLMTHARDLLDELHARDGAALYVSAHDHSGKWGVIGHGLDTWPELNIGAMIDEPVELRNFRLVSTDSTEAAPGRIAVTTPLHRLDSELDTGLGPDVPHCTRHKEWEAKPGDPDFYVSYRQLSAFAIDDVQRNILTVILSSWRRYLQYVKSAPGQPPWLGQYKDDTELDGAISEALKSGDVGRELALAKSLDIDASNRQVVDETIRIQYRICQGWWGSKDELAHRRVPAVDDWSVILPNGGK